MFEFIESKLVAADIARRKFIEKLVDEKGATFTEYIILIAIIAAVVLVCANLIGGAIKGKANEAANVIGSASFSG